MSSVWTRDYLRRKGINNQDIGWNPQTGSVSVYGQDFKPTSVTDGKSYADTASLDKFFQSLQPTMQMNNLMGQIQQAQNWKWNPNQDQGFQQAQKSISRNTMADMNNKGMLLYSGTPERIAQATAEAAPQFESQAYTRNQQNIANLMGLVQQLQAQKQAEEDAKRAQENSTLNTLNVLAGLTGKVPDIGAQFGLKPGDLTASERARQQAAASAAAGSAPSLLEQLRNDLLSGKTTLDKLTPEQRWALNIGSGNGLDAANKELGSIASLMSDPLKWRSLPQDMQDFYTNRASQLQQFIANGGQAQQQSPQQTVLSDAEVPAFRDNARKQGHTDEEIRQELAGLGVPQDVIDKYVPAPVAKSVMPSAEDWQTYFPANFGL